MKNSPKKSLKAVAHKMRTEQFECIANKNSKNKDGSLPGLPTKHL